MLHSHGARRRCLDASSSGLRVVASPLNSAVTGMYGDPITTVNVLEAARGYDYCEDADTKAMERGHPTGAASASISLIDSDLR